MQIRKITRECPACGEEALAAISSELDTNDLTYVCEACGIERPTWSAGTIILGLPVTALLIWLGYFSGLGLALMHYIFHPIELYLEGGIGATLAMLLLVPLILVLPTIATYYMIREIYFQIRYRVLSSEDVEEDYAAVGPGADGTIVTVPPKSYPRAVLVATLGGLGAYLVAWLIGPEMLRDMSSLLTIGLLGLMMGTKRAHGVPAWLVAVSSLVFFVIIAVVMEVGFGMPLGG